MTNSNFSGGPDDTARPDTEQHHRSALAAAAIFWGPMVVALAVAAPVGFLLTNTWPFWSGAFATEALAFAVWLAGTWLARRWFPVIGALFWIGRLVRDVGVGLAVWLGRLTLSAGAGIVAMEWLTPTSNPLVRAAVGLAAGLPVLRGVNRLVRRWFR